MEKKIKTVETAKFDTFEQVQEYIADLNKISQSNMDVDAPRSYEEKWVLTTTWVEETI